MYHKIIKYFICSRIKDQISPEIIDTQKSFGPIVLEGRSLLKKTEGACPKRITTTHGEYTALQWTTVGGARNLHRKSNCHNSWFTPFSLIKDPYLTNLNKKILHCSKNLGEKLVSRPFNLYLDFWKSRSALNLRKISVPANLDFFSRSPLKKN